MAKSYKMKNNSAFTVIEFMIVLAILGILVAIIVPSVKELQEKSAAQANGTYVDPDKPHIVLTIKNYDIYAFKGEDGQSHHVVIPKDELEKRD